MKLKKVDYIGLDHDAVNMKFEGGLTFINYFPIKTENDYFTAAVYKVDKPDKTKGHKKYLILGRQGDSFFVMGKELRDLNKSRYVDALLCKECDTVIYSISRHDFNSCGCKNDAFIDGGLDYNRCGALDLKKTKIVKLDLLKEEIVTK